VEIPPILKKPPVLIGGVVLIVIILIISKRGSSGSTSSASYDAQVASTQSANLSIAQLNAQTAQQQISADVSKLGLTIGGQVNLAGVKAQRDVALSKIATDSTIALQTADYAYQIGNKQLENNRILGLTGEDTKRLLSTQENQTKLTLGITALDTQKYIAGRALQSQEYQAQQQFQYLTDKLSSDERIQDFTTSRALTYANITTQGQVAAIKAGKPSAFAGFLNNLGKGLGGGLSTFIGGL
jgi:hypothetical protein